MPPAPVAAGLVSPAAATIGRSVLSPFASTAVIVALVLVTVAGLAFAYVSYLVIRFMVRVFLADPTVTFEFADADQAPISEDLTVESHTFAAADGTPLSAVLVKPARATADASGIAEAPPRNIVSVGSAAAGLGDGAGRGFGAGAPGELMPRGIVVFAPEFGGDAETWRRYASFIPRAGYWLLAFDFRGTGKSPAVPGYVPRKWGSEREVSDLQGAVAYARTLAGGRFQKIPLFGVSRGGLSALAVAARDPGIPGVVLEGSGSTLEVINSYTEKWSRCFAPERFCAAIPRIVYRWLSKLVLKLSEARVGYRFVEINALQPPASGGPCLFIHGQRDRHVTPMMAQQAFVRWPGPKELWMASGARHNGAAQKHPDEYRVRVLGHLERVTVAAPAALPVGRKVEAPQAAVA